MRPTQAHGSEHTTKPNEELKCYYGEEWRRVYHEAQLAIAEQEELDQKDQEIDAPAGFGLDASLSEEPVDQVPGALGTGVYSTSERGSERTSSSRSNPGTPRGLLALLTKPYDPSKETYERYEKRAFRVSTALNMGGIQIDEQMYDSNLWNAEIASKLDKLSENQQVAWLRKKFQQIALISEEEMRDEIKDWRLDIIASKLSERGFQSPQRYLNKAISGSPISHVASESLQIPRLLNAYQTFQFSEI